MADRGLPQLQVGASGRCVHTDRILLQKLKGNPSSTKNTGAREDERRADMDVRQNQVRKNP
jgi:hypothetical protein